MKPTTLAGSSVLLLFLMTNTVALADGLRALTKRSDSAIHYDFHGGQGVHYVCTALTVDYELSNIGPNHICEVAWTIDNWHTWQVTHAVFKQFIDNKEWWTAEVSIPKVRPDQWQYSVFCTDLTEKYEIYLSPTQKVNSYGLSIRGQMETVRTIDRNGSNNCPEGSAVLP